MQGVFYQMQNLIFVEVDARREAALVYCVVYVLASLLCFACICLYFYVLVP
jgi:hypothetical protein